MRGQTRLTTHDMSIIVSEQCDRLEAQIKRIELISNQLVAIDSRMLKYVNHIDKITQRRLTIDTTSLHKSIEMEIEKVVESNEELRGVMMKDLQQLLTKIRWLILAIGVIGIVMVII